MSDTAYNAPLCRSCGIPFERTGIERELLAKLNADQDLCCSDCNLKNVLAFWPSIGKWYKRKCDFSGETIITNYSEHARFPVYKTQYFDGDAWTPDSAPIDMSRSLFDQLKALQEKIPRPHMLGLNNENCDYCDDAWSCKDCLLSISMLEGENLYYCYRNIRCKDSCDLVFCFDCTQSYSLLNCRDCHHVFFSSNTSNCRDSAFLYDCRNCSDCFMSWNQRNSRYTIFNRQYSKDEYEQKMKEIDLSSDKELTKLKALFNEEIRTKAVHRATMNLNCENLLGNFSSDSKDCHNVNLMQQSESCANTIRGYNDRDCLDSSGIMDGQLLFLVCQSGYLYNVKYSSYCTTCRDSEYLDNCSNCDHCFLCVGIRNKQYHILNRPYPKEEYESKVEALKAKMRADGEYGRFLPYSMAYTGFNTTLSRFYFPDDKAHIESLGGYWENDDLPSRSEDGYILPDRLDDTPADISSKMILCRSTGKPFNVIKQAVDFHVKHRIALPRESHIERMGKMYYPLTFIRPYEGICVLTGEKIISYYGPELGYRNIASNAAYDKEFA